MNNLFIVIGSPSNGNICTSASRSIRNGLNYPNTIIAEESCSVLTYSFNSVWCKALNTNPKPDYFVMHHADIEAEPYWLSRLVEIIKEKKVDVVSCNIALKDERGLTSTAVYDTKTNLRRRITIQELSKLPETFSVKDIPWATPESILLVNTGLWICKVGDWCKNICFRNQDFIFEDSKTGRLIPDFWPEDWIFSIDCNNLGKKIMATSAITINHSGVKLYDNRETTLTQSEDKWYQCKPL